MENNNTNCCVELDIDAIHKYVEKNMEISNKSINRNLVKNNITNTTNTTNNNNSINYKNNKCPLCNQPIEPNKNSIGILTCGHAYHFTCCSNELFKGVYCLSCPKINEKKKKIKFSNIEDEDEEEEENYKQIDWSNGICIRDFDNPKFLKQVEKDEELKSKVNEFKNNLTEEEKVSIAKITLPSIQQYIPPTKKIKETIFNKKYLRKNNITFEELLEANIPLLKIHYALGLKFWQDLLDIGICKADFYGECYSKISIPQLSNFYKVDLVTLKRDLNFTLEDIRDILFDCDDLINLQGNIENLINQFGFGLDDIIHYQVKGGYNFSNWLKLGLEVNHLKRLDIQKDHFIILGWNVKHWASLIGVSPQFIFNNCSKLNFKKKKNFNNELYGINEEQEFVIEYNKQNQNNNLPIKQNKAREAIKSLNENYRNNNKNRKCDRILNDLGKKCGYA